MSKQQEDILKDAIADAKAVRDTALANAKLALTEVFTPRLQSMLTTKLRNEMEGDFAEGDLNTPGLDAQSKTIDPTVHEAKDVTAIAGNDPEAGKAGAVNGGGGQGLEKQGQQALKLTEVEGEEEDDEEEKGAEVPAEDGEIAPEIGAEVPPVGGEEIPPVDGAEIPPAAGDEIPPVEGGEIPPTDDEDDDELEEIIKELESEDEPVVDVAVDAEVPPEAAAPVAPEAEVKTVTADAGVDPEKGLASDVGPESGSETALDSTPTSGVDTVGKPEDESELEYENLVKEIEEEITAEDKANVAETTIQSLRKENVQLKKTLAEYRDGVQLLRGRLNEINLLNAKLLYSNKLFRAHQLNESQRLRVIEAIDRANTIREVKLVYATLAESFKSKTAKPLTEAKKLAPTASKVVRSTKPKEIITEGSELKARWQQLAGVNKVSRIL